MALHVLVSLLCVISLYERFGQDATISLILFGLPVVFNYLELVLPAVPRNAANSLFCLYLCS